METDPSPPVSHVRDATPDASRRVLIVRSWRAEAELAYRETLRLWGFRTAISSDVEDALRMAVEYPCDAIVIDLDIPDGDALALVSALRGHAQTRTLAVVAVTRHEDDATAELALRAGCDVFLAGAVDPPVVAIEVEAALAHPGRRCAA